MYKEQGVFFKRIGHVKSDAHGLIVKHICFLMIWEVSFLITLVQILQIKTNEYCKKSTKLTMWIKLVKHNSNIGDHNRETVFNSIDVYKSTIFMCDKEVPDIGLPLW